MSSLFPLRETVSLDGDREPRLVELDDETADEVFEALAAQTTRKIFLALHEQPQTASDLAKGTDTSVQNAQYHLEKLTEADLVEVVDTWYSERGTEMNVYAPCDDSLVLFAGEDTRSSLERILKRVVGALGVLVPASVLVGWLASQTRTGVDVEPTGTPTDEEDGPEIAEDPVPDDDAPDETPEDDAEEEIGDTVAADDDPSTPFESAEEVVDGATEAIAGLDPAVAVGLGFFLGGLLVLVLAVVVWRYSWV